jgi:hypothetical protein
VKKFFKGVWRVVEGTVAIVATIAPVLKKPKQEPKSEPKEETK